MAEPLPQFRALQYAFAAHIRDPAANAAPAGIEERRLQIYRELFFNNIENLLSIGFPVIKQLYGEVRWRHLLCRFYAEHESHTPLFTELGREFHRYLLTRNERGEPDPPFLAELAHYEWVELALSIDEHEIDAIEHDPAGDVIAGPALVSPLAWLLEYRYPVHRIRADFQPNSAPEHATHLIVARNRRDQIVFTEANPLSFKLLEILQANPGVSGLQVAQALVQALGPTDPQALIAAATGALLQFKQRDILLGTLLPNHPD